MSPIYLATKKMWQARLGSALGWMAGLLTIFRLCPHDWHDVNQIKVFETDEDRRPIFTKYVQRCPNCRKYRSFKI